MRVTQFSRPRRLAITNRLGSGRFFGIAATLATGLALAFGQAEAAPLPTPAPQSAIAMDWLDDLGDVIDDIIDDLEDGEVEASAGTLRNNLRLEASLNRALYQIDQILDPDVYPSLDTTGSVDGTINPVELAEYGEETVVLALDARAELASGEGFDGEFVASALLTIESLITRTEPHNYKTKAGL